MDVIFQKVGKKYGDFLAIDGLDLKIKSGDLHFLLGPSGCGKTTILRLLAGLESASSGSILIGGRDVTKIAPQYRQIGMVFQNYALWPHMTVEANVEYGLKIRGMSHHDRSKTLGEVLKMTRLERFRSRFPSELSGGQQQRVALARALAIRPSVLLLDEPLSNLDAQLRMEMRDNIMQIHQETGITFVYVTHDQKEALSMGNSISVLCNGKIIQEGSPRDLYLKPNSSFISSFMGDTNILKGKVSDVGPDHIIAETTFGTFRASAFIPFQVGDAVELSIRPESIKLELGRPGIVKENNFTLRFKSSSFYGDLEKLTFIGKGHEELKVHLFNAPQYSLHEGEEVECFVMSSKVIALPSSSSSLRT